MQVLVDSSVWLDFFAGKEKATSLIDLIDANQVCVNDLILTELLPYIPAGHQHLSELLLAVRKVDLKIDWEDIRVMQKKNLAKGINQVSIPDLIILQNVIHNDLFLFSFDKHFLLMKKVHSFLLFERDSKEKN